MPTAIANLWIPDIWVRGVNEKAATLPSLISSPIVVRNKEYDTIASGGGVSANVPYFRDITDQDDAPQVENTQPTRQQITSGKMVAPILNREYALDCTALAAQVTQILNSAPMSPIEVIVSQLAMNRQKRRQKVMVAILRGIFGFVNGPGGAGVMSAARNDIFLEAGATPPASQMISANCVIDTITMLGELAPSTLGGGILMHSTVRASLIKQDQTQFEHYSLQSGTVLSGPSPATNQSFIEMYKGYRVYVSDTLVRNGVTNGKVFDTYIFMAGVFAMGEKPQAPQTVDVASLSYWMDTQHNNEEIYDRTRFVLHPNGLRWIGTPAGQSASNAELATPDNWALDLQTASRVGIVCIRSNG